MLPYITFHPSDVIMQIEFLEKKNLNTKFQKGLQGKYQEKLLQGLSTRESKIS
jgi:hypothetical protein